MNKTITFYAWHVLLAKIFVLILSSCGAAVPTSTSIPSTETLLKNTTRDWYPMPTYVYEVPPSDVTGYTHFAPSEKSKIHLEFDYPNSWFFYEYIDEVGIPNIYLEDPRFLTLPTPDPAYADAYMHPIPNDFGIIFIWIIPSKPGKTVESQAEDIKQSYSKVGRATFLNDYKVAIDGFGVRVIEHQIQMPEVHTSMMFERRMYFFAENEIYEIRFTIAEKDRGGEFEQGYEYFFNSLKIIR